jgi:ribosomal-protein-alanine N-acetyltransferase
VEAVKIKLLTQKDTDRLFVFEKENRDYFKSIGLGRSDAYYQYDSFAQIVEELIYEQNIGQLYMYLLIDQEGNIVGRVNLTDIKQEPYKKAELGYRIGKAYQGKGYATLGVKLVLKEAKHSYGLHRIEAGTLPDNIGSQIVLIKNGFQFVGRYNQYILQGDNWADSLIFEKVMDLQSV